MATSKRRKTPARAAEVTARPQPITEELPKRPLSEEGLSVAPEDMGANFLADATEQGNFESIRPADISELDVLSAPLSDEPLVGPNMQVDESIWNHTVDTVLQTGTREPPTLDAAIDESFDEHEQGDEEAMTGVDLLSSGICDGSLFDEEGEELGETKEPITNTDETSRRGRIDRTL